MDNDRPPVADGLPKATCIACGISPGISGFDRPGNQRRRRSKCSGISTSVVRRRRTAHDDEAGQAQRLDQMVRRDIRHDAGPVLCAPAGTVVAEGMRQGGVQFSRVGRGERTIGHRHLR